MPAAICGSLPMRRITIQTTGPSLLRGGVHRFFRLLGGWVLSVAGCSWVVTQGQRLAPWVQMWLLAAVVFAACKLMSWLRLEDPSALTGRRLLAYLVLWPGMRPQPFLPAPERTVVHFQNLFTTGVVNLCAGLFLLALALLSSGPWWLRAWLTMAAVSFVLHFGVFDLLAAAWRHANVPVEKLFVCPVVALSLADFWGKRWNRAFSAFAHDLLFVPTTRCLGSTGGTLLVFGFSGLVHELMISVPAGGGYGGPVLYFLIQGILVVLENIRALRALLRRRPLCARVWTAVAILAPLPLLFHIPFLQRIVLPFLVALGG